MSEPHRHCQCDHCSGQDCGQDNTERYLEEMMEQEDALREEGAKQERERLRVDTESPLFWSIGRIEGAMRDNACIRSELDGVLPRLHEISESLRGGQHKSKGDA